MFVSVCVVSFPHVYNVFPLFQPHHVDFRAAEEEAGDFRVARPIILHHRYEEQDRPTNSATIWSGGCIIIIV